MSRLFRRVMLALIATATLGAVSVGPSAALGQSQRGGANGAAGPVLPPTTAAKAQQLIRDLGKSGYEVSVGYPTLYTQSDCDKYTYPILKSCFGNNPAAPYIVPVVKSWPEEAIDPATANALGKTRPGYSATYRLDPREAIVILGELPPQGRYMGLQSWVFTKGWLTATSPWNTTAQQKFATAAPDLAGYLFGTVPGNGDRVLSFSSLSNNINNVVIANQSTSAFGQTRYFVITPDQAMDRGVRAALAQVGVAGDDVFTEPIPASDERGSIGPLGLGMQSDEFLTLLRYAVPDDERLANTWRHTLPMTVLRIRENPSSSRSAEPYGTFVADPRSATPEAALAPAMTELVSSVCAQAEASALDVANSGCAHPAGDKSSSMLDLVNDLGQFGPVCRSIGMDCLGDGQDASYFIAPSKPLDAGQVYAVVSTLATNTNNATYVGLSVNDISTLKGVVNITDTALNGSASTFESPGQDFGKFFVHYFTRDCSLVQGLPAGTCTSITTGMVPRQDDISAPGPANLHGKFSAALRAYVKPGTSRGPLSSEQLRPRILTFALK